MTLKYYIKFKRKLYTRNLRHLSDDVVFFFYYLSYFLLLVKEFFLENLECILSVKKTLMK